MKETARTRAEAFLEFCAGVEDVGMIDFARRGRSVADDCLRALDELTAERSARRAIQERNERLQEIVAAGAYRACVAAER